MIGAPIKWEKLFGSYKVNILRYPIRYSIKIAG